MLGYSALDEVQRALKRRRIILTEDALRIRDGLRWKSANILLYRRDVLAVELLDPPGKGDNVPVAGVPADDVPEADVRIEFAVGAAVRLRTYWGLRIRSAPDSVRARLIDDNSMTFDVRDGGSAYPVLMNWVEAGPGGPAARRRMLARVARVGRTLTGHP